MAGPDSPTGSALHALPESKVVWQPSPELMAASHLQRFMEAHTIRGTEELHRRSTTELDWFWNAVLKDLDIRFDTPYSRVCDTSRGLAWTQWCVGGRMNIVSNCLDKYAGTATDLKPAVEWEDESGSAGSLSYAELLRDVNRMANALRGLGLARGDVIGVFMPMTPEIVVAMLAIIRIGAIFLPLFSGYGAEAIASRLSDAQAKALFTADGCRRRGKATALYPLADEAAARVGTLKAMIVLKRLGERIGWRAGRDHWWHELMAGARDQSAAEVCGADDPMMLLYTSGTTGKPKGAVHSHCGFPVKAAQDMRHGLDLHGDEVLFWVTDMGWMMGPWLVFGSLLLGATMMIYDGAPDYPGPDRIWSLVQRHKVTTLGISPTLVRALLKFGEGPVRAHDLSSLRKFGSTGEPWNEGPWNWLFHVAGGGRLPIINYSGGTEISGGILMGNVLTPLKPCAFAGPLPGMAADVLDERGHSLRGEVGELVLRQPWIGMTRGFWRDPERYLATYWSRFPDIWVHGDWAVVGEDCQWYILGRSDDTIKVAGKRVGPAEVESVLVGHEAVSEAAAIGVPDDIKGEALVCFCVLKPGRQYGEELGGALIERVAAALGKPLTPKAVYFVADLPKTRNAKVMRRVIRSTFLGQNPGDLSALENVGAIEEIRRVRKTGWS